MSVSPHSALQSRTESVDGHAANVLLDVHDISKRYHLWESPRGRLIYGLWSQVPRWAPQPLQRIAENEKVRLGRDFYALQNVSLQLGRGESLAILGRNGSGKSTLLQIISGTLRPSAGAVNRNCQRIAALLELGSGFNPEFTGRENVYLNGTVLGLSKAEIAARFHQIQEFAEIGEFIEQPVKTYSNGMMVRLAFAVQVLLEPELLIVDEALAVGDVFFQQKCFAYMRRLKERGCAFLIVSHDTASIQQFCDRGLVLIDGRKHFEGVSREAIREYYLTEKVHLPRSSGMIRSVGDQPSLGENNDIAEPERWFEPRAENRVKNQLARLIRWSCTDESSRVAEQFFPNQQIRLFVEFECLTSVREASAGFALRDKTGQMIHGKHLYQIRPDAKINSQPPFVLRCEFTFPCRLAYGEYTIEFGLIDIHQQEPEDPNGSVVESYEVLCSDPPAGRFAVVPHGVDSINRGGHFGIVDVEAEVNFCTYRTKS
jgi:lipopolysaccharide transport system ATP-binding protein